MGAEVSAPFPDASERAETWDAMFRAGVACFPVSDLGKVPSVKEWQKSVPVGWESVSGYFDENPGSNVGALCGSASGGVFAIDIDTEEHGGVDGMEAVREWEREHGAFPDTVSSITGTGGCHLFYRAPEGTFVKTATHVDIGVDVRGEGGFVVVPPSVHPNGNAYQWENPPYELPIADADANVMAFLDSIQGVGGGGCHEGGGEEEKEPFVLPDRIAKGGRNDTLFRFASKLRGGGFGAMDIMALLGLVNASLCEIPLDKNEIERICDSACKYQRGRGGGGRDRLAGEDAGDERKLDFSSNATLHRDIANHLIEDLHCKFIGGVPAIWVNDHYETGWEPIDRASISCRSDIKKGSLNEIRERIAAVAPRVDPADDMLIAFNNGVLDVGTMLFDVNTPDLAITNIIPHDWDPECYDEAADEFIMSIAGNDPATACQLYEVIGMCMMRSSKFEQCAVLVGDGANGKSTYIKAVRNVLGDDNVSALDICSLAERFQAGSLMGKLANLGDDISNDFLHGNTLSVFKKVASGDWVWTDVKGMDGMQFRPICTMVISCNEFPRLKDASYGMMRRLVGIDFSRKFDAESGNVDLDIVEKLCTERAAKWFIKAGIDGLRNVIEQRGMTKSRHGSEMVDEIEKSNNSVLQWIEYMDIDADFLVGSKTDETYRNYSQWCLESGIKPYALNVFSKNANKALGLKTVQQRENGVSKRFFALN